MQELESLNDHPLATHYPTRLPVWWGRDGEIHKSSFKNGLSGKRITISIVKKFSRIESLIAKLFRAPKIVRHPLDEMNSSLWELCDGQKTFSEICLQMNLLFQENIAPVVSRTALSLNAFQRKNILILLDEPLNGRWYVGPGYQHEEIAPHLPKQYDIYSFETE